VVFENTSQVIELSVKINPFLHTFSTIETIIFMNEIRDMWKVKIT
jgi:hypothetical protein